MWYGFRHALVAECSKLWTLPAARLTVVAAVLVAGLLGAALASLPVADGGPATAGDAVRQTVPYLQAAAILLGLLPIAQEYSGRQISTTLVTQPQRGVVVVAKTVVIAAAGLLAAALSVMTTSVAVLLARGEGAEVLVEESRSLVGAVVGLALITLLSHALVLLLPRFVPGLVIMVCLVFLIPPVVAGLGDLSRWLPSVAVAELSASGVAADTLTAAGIVFGWIAVVGAIGGWRFLRADA